jgi:glucosamine-6-phosphate deaminase
MSLAIYADAEQCGLAAGQYGAQRLRDILTQRGAANVIVATGASQFVMLSTLAAAPGIDWSQVTLFHLDEYVGLPESHPASFRKYIKERFVANLPKAPKKVFYVDGSAADPAQVCAELNATVKTHPIDLCFMGIGENGHVAFNDPPADFASEEPYLLVDLDEKCRRQQLGEGWFPSLEAVPKQAISMSVWQVLQSKCIVNTVPDARKAHAMKISFEGEMCPNHPASVIRLHPDCHSFCDQPAAAELSELTRKFCRR